MSETFSNVSAVDAAARAQNIWFVVYVVVLLAAAALTVVLRQATSRYQALVKADADARIAETRLAQQRVDVELAKQQERAAIAERSLLELQEKLRPRTLSSEQRARLIEALSRTPKGPIEFLHVEGDHEAFDYAEQVRDVLQKAGWDVGQRTIMLGVNVVGTLIVVRDAQSAPSYAGALQKAFASASLDLVGTLDNKLPQGTVRIIVGHKP